jgi:hypothetical protein
VKDMTQEERWMMRYNEFYKLGGNGLYKDRRSIGFIRIKDR